MLGKMPEEHRLNHRDAILVYHRLSVVEIGWVHFVVHNKYNPTAI